jgi:hypothetical protein
MPQRTKRVSRPTHRAAVAVDRGPRPLVRGHCAGFGRRTGRIPVRGRVRCSPLLPGRTGRLPRSWPSARTLNAGPMLLASSARAEHTGQDCREGTRPRRHRGDRSPTRLQPFAASARRGAARARRAVRRPDQGGRRHRPPRPSAVARANRPTGRPQRASRVAAKAFQPACGKGSAPPGILLLAGRKHHARGKRCSTIQPTSCQVQQLPAVRWPRLPARCGSPRRAAPQGWRHHDRHCTGSPMPGLSMATR